MSAFDRRSEPRWVLNQDTNCQISYGSTQFDVHCADLSLKGAQVSTKQDLPLGSYVSLTMTLQNSVFDLDAKLVRKSHSDTNHTLLGLLLVQRKDLIAYQRAIDASAKRPLPARRDTLDRRLANQSIVNNRRAVDRRGAATIKKRIIDEGYATDDWISRHQYQRIIQSASSNTIITSSKEKIMLGGNNYLGMTQHPRVKEAAIKAVEKYGAGAGSVRMLGGSMDLHQQLEERLAAFKGAEACVLLPSGYSANFAVLTTILKRGDIALNDELNHASIFDGCRATPATTRFYRHRNLRNLEKRIAQYDNKRPKLIITDGVFSMDGDIAPLKEILSLAKTHGAMVMVDDAHATGVIGATGRGTAEYCGVFGQADITICTLSKGLGMVGGAICGSRALVKLILHYSRSFLFTSALPPSVAASALAAIDVIESEPHLLQQLRKNCEFLAGGLETLGYTVWKTPSAILPVIIGEEDKTYELAALLNEMGVFVNAVTQPAVARTLCRLRVSVMATHTQSDLERALDAFKKAGKQLHII